MQLTTNTASLVDRSQEVISKLITFTEQQELPGAEESSKIAQELTGILEKEPELFPFITRGINEYYAVRMSNALTQSL